MPPGGSPMTMRRATARWASMPARWGSRHGMSTGAVMRVLCPGAIRAGGLRGHAPRSSPAAGRSILGALRHPWLRAPVDGPRNPPTRMALVRPRPCRPTQKFPLTSPLGTLRRRDTIERLMRDLVAHRSTLFTESVIREMTRLCQQHGGVNLAQGFPDFPAPDL